ncbi:hypothetical protein [Nannocystis sp.]|uniref:hypothetical protein n=2 Tax=Nannocystis sp. TaxID=1962667 RepID=UPI0025ED5A8B|nr:hypothetical protein [Nannocystis sp.]MBK7824858.1 hypothetical protein [Nannocystis sp.]
MDDERRAAAAAADAGVARGLWDAATLWLPVGERGARAGFAALLLALAVAAAAGWLAFHLYRGTGRRPAAFAAVPVTAAGLLAWLCEAATSEVPAILGFALFATLALGLVIGARVHGSGSARRLIAGSMAALIGALLWPRAGVGLLAGLLVYCTWGIWTTRTAVWRRAAAALGLGLAPLLAFGTGILRHDPTDSSWRAAWWMQLRLAPELAELRRVVGATSLYPALALLVLLVLPLRWRAGGLLLGVAGLGLVLADRSGLLAPAPALLVLVSVAACGWIWLAGSAGGRWAAWATTLVLLAVTATRVVFAAGPASRRPEASLLALHQRGLVAPGDVLLAHDPWLVLAFAAAQRDEGLRPDVEVIDATSRDPAWLAERRIGWSREGRRVLSDSFSLAGRLRAGSPLDSGPLFWFTGSSALEPLFTDLRRFSPTPGWRLRPDEAARWERLHVERARHRRALGRHEEAMLALPFADEDFAVLTRQLQLAELSRLPATEGSELGPGAWSQALAPASAMAEAGDLLLALGGGADGAARLAEAADRGVAEALAALVRWQLRAGEEEAASATLRVLAAAPVLRPQVLGVCRWLLLHGRPQEAATLLGAVGPAAQFAPEELALRLATLRELAPP